MGIALGIGCWLFMRPDIAMISRMSPSKMKCYFILAYRELAVMLFRVRWESRGNSINIPFLSQKNSVLCSAILRLMHYV